jgi:hypothetical protein
VKVALGLRHIIRVCSSSQQARVVEAARRLLANAEQIRQSGINLQGNVFTCLTHSWRARQDLGPGSIPPHAS